MENHKLTEDQIYYLSKVYAMLSKEPANDGMKLYEVWQHYHAIQGNITYILDTGEYNEFQKPWLNELRRFYLNRINQYK